MGHSIAAPHERPRATLVDENGVRAAAGLTMVIGAVAFAYAYFAKQYVPLQVPLPRQMCLTQLRPGTEDEVRFGACRPHHNTRRCD